MNTQKKVISKEEENMRLQNSSRNFLLIWGYSSHYKSTASYDKTKIPLNLRRKTVSQILSREVSILQFFIHCFSTFHQVSSLHQVSAKCTHAYDTGAFNGFWLKVTWWRYSILFTFQFAERSPMTPLATYLSKSRPMARFQSHQGVHFYEK